MLSENTKTRGSECDLLNRRRVMVQCLHVELLVIGTRKCFCDTPVMIVLHFVQLTWFGSNSLVVFSSQNTVHAPQVHEPVLTEVAKKR